MTRRPSLSPEGSVAMWPCGSDTQFLQINELNTHLEPTEQLNSVGGPCTLRGLYGHLDVLTVETSEYHWPGFSKDQQLILGMSTNDIPCQSSIDMS